MKQYKQLIIEVFLSMKINKNIGLALGVALLATGVNTAFAACSDVKYKELTAALTTVAALKTTGGYSLPMWATIVDESGKICSVATSGKSGAMAGNSEWLGSRVISAQKAFTANAFSLDGYAISTANLYAAVQPGGSLFGLQHSNPVDAAIAYAGSPSAYGTANDPLVGKRIGGVNVFGGGLALYKSGKKVGAIGVSGDTSCRDHAFAWNLRSTLGLLPTPNSTTKVAAGITTVNMDASGTAQTPLANATYGDELIISGGNGYWNAWAQPACPNSSTAITKSNGTLQAQ